MENQLADDAVWIKNISGLLSEWTDTANDRGDRIAALEGALGTLLDALEWVTPSGRLKDIDDFFEARDAARALLTETKPAEEVK